MKKLYVVVFDEGKQNIYNVFEDKHEALGIFKCCDRTINFYVIKCGDQSIIDDMLELTSVGKDCSKLVYDYCEIID